MLLKYKTLSILFPINILQNNNILYVVLNETFLKNFTYKLWIQPKGFKK